MFLLKRQSTYYYNRRHFGCLIRFSLRTGNRKEALRFSLRLAEYIDRHCAHMTRDEIKALMVLKLAEYRAASREQKQPITLFRAEEQPSEAPFQAQNTANEHIASERFSARFEAFLASKVADTPDLKAARLKDYRNVIQEFDALSEFPLMPSVNFKTAEAYIEKLRQLPSKRYLSQYKGMTTQQLLNASVPPQHKYKGKTINERLRPLRGYCDWLVRHGAMQTNPFTKLNVSQSDSRSYSSLDDLDLKQLLTRTRLFNPSCQYFSTYGRKTYWWLVVLAIFTGARVGELDQLFLTDIKQKGGIDYFHIHDNDADKTVKTKNAVREVPLHSCLIELGLLEYIQSLEDSGETKLLPSTRQQQKWGDKASEWFNQHLRDKDLPDWKQQNKTFHSFRGTFIGRCMDSDSAESSLVILQKVVGHEAQFKNVLGATAAYKKDFPLSHKKRVVEAFRLIGFDDVIDHLKEAASWRKLPLK